jgi:hypothetical protein
VSIWALWFGLSSVQPKQLTVENNVESDTKKLSQQIIAEWENVDPYLQDCSEIGAILRKIASKDQYSYRLFLIIPQSSDNGFILVNDGGTCWVDGEKYRPRLADQTWFKEYFEKGRAPDTLIEKPFLGIHGVWTVLPIKESVSIWGALLAQDYQGR